MKRGAYTVEARPADLLTWLARAHAEDKKAEQRTSRTSCVAALLFFSSMGFLFFGDAVDGLYHVSGGTFLLCLVFVVAAMRFQVHDLDDHKIAACQGLLKVLQADLPPERPLRLVVDYRDYAAGAFRVSKEGRFMGEQVSRFRQPWLSLEGRLADGARFRLEVVRRAERLDYWKSSGGKRKRRFKDRVTDRLEVELRAPGRAGAPVSPPPLGLVARRVEVTGDAVTAVLVTPRARRTFRVNLGPGDLVNADRLLGALAWLHRGLGATGTASPPG